MKANVFEFENLAAKDKAIRETARLFSRAGAQVVATEVAKALSRRAGVSFRNIDFTFADGQTVTLAVKATGDVFEVKINGKVTPMRQQDDHAKAIVEITERMDRGRGAYQRALARVKVPVPAGIRVSRTAQLAAKVEKRDALKEAVGLARGTLAGLTGEAAPAAA